MQFQIVKTADGASFLSVVIDGDLYSADESHPRWAELVERVVANDESVAGVFNIASAVTAAFEQVTERVVFRDGKVLFDGDPIDVSLEKRILDFYRDDLDFSPLVYFLEKVMQNPNPHSREQLYRWLLNYDFPITADGDIVAYKGINADFTSRTAGPGIVNGVTVKGNLDNSPGNVLEMARSSVQHDPSVGCSVGLHAGTWEYASDFGAIVVAVVFNPRDVVSVPTDCASQKVRVSRYIVANQVTAPEDSALWEGVSSKHTEEPVDSYADEEDLDYEDEDDLDYENDEDEFDDEEDEDSIEAVLSNIKSNYYNAFSAKVNTALNHLKQQRDAKGRFLKP